MDSFSGYGVFSEGIAGSKKAGMGKPDLWGDIPGADLGEIKKMRELVGKRADKSASMDACFVKRRQTAGVPITIK